MIILIIGGVAGGATAAARLRRLDENAEIIIVERTGYISYANCGLPYYIGDEIKDQNALTLQTPESFHSRFKIDVRIRQEARSIDPKQKTVTILDLTTKETYVETYDLLLLAPGARSTRPDFLGGNDARIFTLRTVEDTLKIKTHIVTEKPKSAVIVGGGYIGMEMVENLTRQRLDVTIVQKPKQLLSHVDYDMACHVHAYLKAKNIKLRLNDAVADIEPTDRKIKVATVGGETIFTDMVLFAVGITPDTAFIKNTGMDCNENGAIVVNEHMETSIPDIYAVGDAVEIKNSVSGQKAMIALAGPANKQGRIAADNICGIPTVYQGATAASIIRVFDLVIASVGLNEATAKVNAIDYDQVVLQPASHATYYPDAKLLTIKVLFERGTGRIIGAQIVGFDGVDKRIDVLATAIRAKMTAYDLTELDLAYAPPYSSAKDPVNMAGYIIENILTGKVKQFYWDEVACLPQDGSVTLLDVRTVEEYDKGHVEGFANIPVDELRAHLTKLDKSRAVYVLCQTGLRSYLACRILSQNGFQCFNLAGGYRFWETVTKEHALETEAPFPCGIKKFEL